MINDINKIKIKTLSQKPTSGVKGTVATSAGITAEPTPVTPNAKAAPVYSKEWKVHTPKKVQEHGFLKPVYERLSILWITKVLFFKALK